MRNVQTPHLWGAISSYLLTNWEQSTSLQTFSMVVRRYAIEITLWFISIIEFNKWQSKREGLPHVKGFRTRDILMFFIENLDGGIYLPNKFDERILDRNWLINLCKLDFHWLIINSLHFDTFNDFAERKLVIRQDKLLKFNSLSIKVSPELTHFFTNSQMISSIFCKLSNCCCSS